MQDKSPKPFNMRDTDDEDELTGGNFFVASATDCTGLIPAAPAAEHEVDSYNEIYDVPLASDPNDAQNHMQDIHKSDSSLFKKRK